MKPLIMCVEDDHDIQYLLEMSLISIGGFDVCLASDGLDALRKLETLSPDLIIVDWMMPDMNGMELSKKIRECKDFKNTKLLLLSAKTNVIQLLGDESNLFDEIIIKPFDPLSLPSLVQKHLYSSN